MDRFDVQEGYNGEHVSSLKRPQSSVSPEDNRWKMPPPPAVPMTPEESYHSKHKNTNRATDSKYVGDTSIDSGYGASPPSKEMKTMFGSPPFRSPNIDSLSNKSSAPNFNLSLSSVQEQETLDDQQSEDSGSMWKDCVSEALKELQILGEDMEKEFTKLDQEDSHCKAQLQNILATCRTMNMDCKEQMDLLHNNIAEVVAEFKNP